MGTDCLAELRGLVAFAPDERAARHGGGLLGTGWFADYRLCFPRR